MIRVEILFIFFIILNVIRYGTFILANKSSYSTGITSREHINLLPNESCFLSEIHKQNINKHIYTVRTPFRTYAFLKFQKYARRWRHAACDQETKTKRTKDQRSMRNEMRIGFDQAKDFFFFKKRTMSITKSFALPDLAVRTLIGDGETGEETSLSNVRGGKAMVRDIKFRI
jgi:hypothetical protein